MKYKDYFLKLKEQGKISNEAFDKFLDTVPEGEVPDDVFQVLENTFLTVDRASSHKDVANKLRAEILDPLRNDLNDIMKFLPAEIVLDAEKETSIYKKLAKVKDGLPIAFQKASKAPNDEEAKKKIQEYQHANQELLAKFEKLNTDSEKHKKDLQADFEGKIKNYKLDSELEKRANSFTFAEAFKETRGSLTKAILNEIKAKNKLDLVEKDGEFDIAILDDAGTPRFDGNTAVTISSLLEGPFKPFLKVSEGEPAGQEPARKTFSVDPKNSKTRTGAQTEVKY